MSYLSIFSTGFSCLNYAVTVFSYCSVVGIKMDRLLALNSPVYYNTLDHRYPLVFLTISLTLAVSVFCTCFYAPGGLTDRINVLIYCQCGSNLQAQETLYNKSSLHWGNYSKQRKDPKVPEENWENKSIPVDESNVLYILVTCFVLSYLHRDV